jgi:para-nitrobenzyl esterase
MTIVETRGGKIEGETQDGVTLFKAIPYAAPPVGDLRWMPPQSAKPWAGVRKAEKFSDTAMQNASMMDGLFGGSPWPASEDCLYLNVWTPGADSKKRPVMVWLHGGAFVIGSGSEPIYISDRLARRGDVVVVTVNYRLGTLGFLNLKEVTKGAIPATGNEGLLDMVAALQWVKDNIAAFGGDPANVTIFGESAGGMSVGALLGLPAAKGLFHKAIPQSGACHTAASKAQAVRVAEAVMAAAEMKTADDLRKAEGKVFMRAQAHLALNKVPGHTVAEVGGMPFRPAVDGEVLPDYPIHTVRGGATRHIPIMTGTTTEEWKLFGAMEKAITGLNEESMLKRLNLTLPDVDFKKLLAPYPAMLQARGEEPTPPNLFMAVQTDRIFGAPATRLMEAHTKNGGTGYAYLFDWKSPIAGGAFGACHALELGYVFGTYSVKGAEKFSGSGPQADVLATTMMDAWIAFARSGKPGWASYDLGQRTTMMFGAQSKLISNPTPAIRQAWDAIPDALIGAI